MGAAIGAAILDHQSTPLFIAELNKDRILHHQNHQLNANFCSPETVFLNSEIVFLGIKPQGVHDLASDISSFVNKSHTLVSMLAGINTTTLTQLFNTKNIIRIMPNTPAMLGEGVTGIYCSKDVSKDRQDFVRQLCDYFGHTIVLNDEDLMHTITALSGSGPAFFYEFIQAFKSFGMANGLDETVSTQAAIGTMLGAAKMLQVEPNPEALVKRVASPNGTTEAGLKTLANLHVDSHIESVLNAAKQRSIELMEE